MSATFTFTTHGTPATAALGDAIAAAKGGDVLAPVTVVVPSNLVGVSARRTLAAGRPEGLAAVRFETLLNLARLLAGPALEAGGGGHQRVTDPVVAAAVRSVLASSADLLRPVAGHPATERALVRVHRELRELDAADLDALAATGPRATEVVRLHREVHGRLDGRYVDEVDLHRAATATVAAGHPLLDDLGALVLHLPERLPASGLTLVEALANRGPLAVVAARTSDESADDALRDLVGRLGGALPDAPPVAADARLLVRSVADPDEEARLAVREVMAGARDGIPFNRMAIAHPGTDRHARLLHQHLSAADVPFNGVAGRRLGDSLTGRTLLALLALPDHDLSRTAVMALLASGAVLGVDGLPVPAAAWERIARRAGVVAGLGQWGDRLRRYAADEDSRLAELWAEGADEGALRGPRERRVRAEQLLAFVERLAEDVDPAQRSTDWPGLTRWALSLLEHYLGAAGDRADWPAEEADAHDRVGDLLRNLSGLGAIESAPGLANFRRAVADGLDREVDREGRFGNGVFVGGIGATAGLDLDRVVVVGLSEGAVPPRRRDDPLLSDAVRREAGGALPVRADHQADLHRAVLATFAAGALDKVLVHARGDLGAKVEAVPSRWLLDEVEAVLGRRPTPEEFTDRRRFDADWFDTSASFAQSLERIDQPADVHEYGLAALLRERHRGLPIDASDRRNGDAVLSRGIDLHRGREQPHLTRFTGLVEGHDLPSPADGRTVLSATRLEAWVKCPHAYFMGHVLGVGTLDDPADEDGITPRDRGSLAHQVLDRFLTEVIEADDLPDHDRPWGPAHRERLDRICDEEFALVESRGLTGRPLLWQREGGRLRRALHEFLLHDDARRAGDLLTPAAAELAFGFDGHEPFVLRLADGRRLRFRGRIDRVDRAVGGGLVVTDYKAGKRGPYVKVSEATPDLDGRFLQLPLYGLAARERLGPTDADVEARFWFLTDGGGVVGHPLSPAVLGRFDHVLTTIVDGIEAGFFPARPPEQKGYGCDYCNPDDLGTRTLEERWEQIRDDGRLDAYRHLIGDLDDDGPTAVIDLGGDGG